VGWIVGATLPRVSGDGRWQGDVELRHTGIRYYEHGQFQSGFTRRRWLLGEPLGPNANGGYAWLRYVPSPATRVELALAQEWRNADTYSSSGGDAAETLRFHVVERRPREHRTRLVVTGEQRALRSSWGRLVTEAGYEHVRNFDFADGRSRGNLLGRIALEARY